MPNGSWSNRFCVPSGVPTVVVGRGKIRGLYSTAFCGCLGTGAQWRELPQTYPPYQTCHRRFQQWVRAGKLERVLRVLAEELQARGKLNPEEAFIDASFTGAKKGASGSGLPNAARGRKSLFSPMITVFLSLLVSKALRRTKANLSKGSSGTVSSTPSQRD
jgi:hypothetical protein